MDSVEQAERRTIVNKRWREAVAGRSPGERHRLDRCAVYAVAVGDRLGLSDEELATLRFAVLGEPADTLLESIAHFVRQFESAAFSDSDPRPDREAVLATLRQVAEPQQRRIVDALAAIEPLIQPVDARTISLPA